MSKPANMYRALIDHPEIVSYLIEHGEGLSSLVVAEAESLRDRVLANASVNDWKRPDHPPENKLRRLAVFFVLTEAALRRQRWRCPHAFTLDRTTTVLLGPGISFCEGCRQDAFERFSQLGQPEDGRCDICDCQVNHFWPFVYQEGIGLFQGDMCDECYGFHERLIAETVG